MIRGPGPAVLRLDGGEWTKYRLLLGLWSKDRGLSKTIQRQLSSGNTIVKTWAGACFMSDSALALGSRSMGLGKVVQEPQAMFRVEK